MSGKVNRGNFFEDFRVGQEINHSTPRTITDGDAALGLALFGSRFVVNSSAEVAKELGLRTSPIDDLMVFSIVLGKTVADVSFNAVSNLGYGDDRRSSVRTSAMSISGSRSTVSRAATGSRPSPVLIETTSTAGRSRCPVSG